MFTHPLRRVALFITVAALIVPAAATAAQSSAAPAGAQPAKAAKAKRAQAKRAHKARAAAAKRHRRAVARTLMASDDLWATVNICDTPKNPNAIGIRASMPGTGETGQMSLRYRVQYYIPANDSWQWVQNGGDSGWVALGSAFAGARQAGYTFAFVPPATGVYTMRGVVDYQWRVNGKVVYTAQEGTHRGHANADLGDPAGFSAGLCTIS